MHYFATEHAPNAIGPYSQAVSRRGMVFISGQIPLDPATGKLVEGDFQAQALRVFDNLRAVLEASGATFADVVKATVFLKDLSDFQTLNAVYAENFGSHKPARSTVGVAQLPMNASLEIDLVAILDKS